MISQRQIDFRQEYRLRILGWYDGYLHVVIIYAMGAAAFYVYVEHIHRVTTLEWLTVPLTFLFTNLFEWARAQIHHASAGGYQRSARDLRAAHAQSSSVFQRRGDAVPRP
jgi:hypothetical protein